MKFQFLLIISFFIISTACSENRDGAFDKINIKNLLAQQQSAWNQGDIDRFMQAYWRSDSLQFYNAEGVTYGWHNTLDNYKVRYPDRSAMGTLTFGIESLKRLGPDGMILLGTYHLEREKDQLDGYYTLVWERIHNEWKIVMDMTCAL